MTHDPLCTQPVRALSRPGLTVLNGTCDCKVIAQARADMLAKCIAAVQDRRRLTLHPLENAGIGEAIAALRALQEKP